MLCAIPHSTIILRTVSCRGLSCSSFRAFVVSTIPYGMGKDLGKRTAPFRSKWSLWGQLERGYPEATWLLASRVTPHCRDQHYRLSPNEPLMGDGIAVRQLNELVLRGALGYIDAGLSSRSTFRVYINTNCPSGLCCRF